MFKKLTDMQMEHPRDHSVCAEGDINTEVSLLFLPRDTCMHSAHSDTH